MTSCFPDTLKAGAVIVTFNPDIATLHRSINELITAKLSVIVVDNGSKNALALDDLIASNTTVEHLANNYGIAYAQNRGLEKLIELGVNDFILLDQDSVIKSKDILRLFQVRTILREVGIKVGIVAPNIPAVTNIPITPDPIPENLIDSLYRTSLFQASGSCFDVELLNSIGFPEEDLFIDFVDYEWNFRAQGAGYINVVTPFIGIEHEFGTPGTTRKGVTYPIHGPIRRYYACRNAFTLLSRPYIPFQTRLDFCLTPFRAIYADILNHNINSQNLSAIARGVLAGLQKLFATLFKKTN